MTLLYSERVDSEDHTQLLQWGISLLLVIVMHFSVALWLFSREAAFEAVKPAPPAAYIDLAPIMVPKVGTPSAVPVPANPAALPPLAPSTPEVKPEAPAVKPPPPVPDIPKIAVPPPKTASVKAPPPPKPPKPQVQPKPQPQTQPAPDTGPPSLTGSQPIVRLSPVAAWQASVIAQITSLKKWPPQAVQMKLTGTAVLFIRVDRMGNVLEYRLLGSSGYGILDKATLDMARRAVRLSPLPAQIPGEDYGFNLSVDWF